MDRTVVSDRLVGQVLDGRYRVGAKVARGGMATVYEAIDLRLDRRVALKVMPHALADDREFAQRFVREARAAARLTHPNVVAVYDQGDDNDTLFLAMEYVEGRRTLRDVIRDEAPLEPGRALALLEEILQAIAAAHESGIIHRDVKPENVLISPRGQVKVADFGLARAISSATTATATGGVLMGTVSYLAPELVTEGTADARSDVYALGVLLFELLTGTKPHAGESPIQVAYKHVHDDVPPPSTLVDSLPAYVDAFVARATARQRDLRPADAHVMLRQLRRVRHAVDTGVADDQELTDDLTPTVAILASPEIASLGRDEVFDQDSYDDEGSGREPTLVVGSSPATEHTVESPSVDQDEATDPPTRRRRSRRGLVAFLVVLLLAAGAAAAGWYYGVGRYQDTPNVLRQSERSATAELRSAGLELRIGSTAYSETVPQGHVVSTSPGPGDNVLKEGTVTAVISKGPERHDVPRLAALTESEAIDTLTSHSLSVGKVKRRWSESEPEGEVLGFHPKAGTPLKPDAPVAMTVSKGPEPIKVEDFAGSDADTAADRLVALGLDVTRVGRYNDGVPDGEVISQRPDSGIRYRGDTVTLVVSKGPHLVEVPDVFQYGVADAKAALEDAGFSVEVQDYDVTFGLGYVVSQSPGGGELAPYGSTIVIKVV